VADLNVRIIPRNSHEESEVPTPSELLVGEFAINTADGYGYVKHDDNTIHMLGVETTRELLDVSDQAPQALESLIWDADLEQWVPSRVKVEDLSDLTVFNPESRHVLQYNGSYWNNQLIDLGGTSIGGLSDVNLTDLETNQGLRFDGSDFVPFDYFEDPMSAQGDIMIRFGGNTTRLGIGTTGQVLTVVGGIPSWVDTSVNGSIDELSDVDTSSTPPTNGQGLVWSAADASWVPGSPEAALEASLDDLLDVDVALPQEAQVLTWASVQARWVASDPAGGVEEAPEDSGLYVRQNASWVAAPEGEVEEAPVNGISYVRQDASWIPLGDGGGGDGGGGINVGLSVQEPQQATSGLATFTGLGMGGTLQQLISSLDAWVVLYSSESARTADVGRGFNEDPELSDGVLFEAYLSSNSPLAVTPGITYLNNEEPVQEAIYAAIRDQSGFAVDAVVTITALAYGQITEVSGGSFGSGV